MGFTEISSFIKEVGFPIAAFFCVLSIWYKSQNGITKQMSCIKEEISKLTICIKETVLYLKMKGGV